MPSTIHNFQFYLSIHLDRFERRVWSVSVFLWRVIWDFIFFHSIPSARKPWLSFSFYFYSSIEVWNSKNFYHFFFSLSFFIHVLLSSCRKLIVMSFFLFTITIRKKCNCYYDQTETFPLHWLRISTHRNQHPAIKIK